MILDELITDRTQDDVDRWSALSGLGWGGMTAEERAEWSAGMKGAYNVGDLNRVQEAMEYVAERLKTCGCSISLQSMHTWVRSDRPARTDMELYLANLSVLRNALTMPADSPEAPDTMEHLTYQEANDIEQILLDLDQLIQNIAAAWCYSGETYSGEV